jgi:hypothetical protein
MDPNGGSGRGTEVAAVKSPGAAVKSPGTPAPKKRHDPSPTLELRYACNTGSGSTSSLLVGLFCSFGYFWVSFDTFADLTYSWSKARAFALAFASVSRSLLPILGLF